MTLTEYVRRKEAIIRRLLIAVLWVFQAFFTPFLTRRSWNQMLRALYPVMKQFRDESTTLAREFYDANRARETDLPRHDIFKDDYYPIEWFAEAMEPVYRDFKRTGNVDAAILQGSGRLSKVIEDAARRTIIQGVQTDTSAPVRGWARYDPEPPTCSFCLMMISRGPVYMDAANAGLDLDDESAEELWQRNDVAAMRAMMNRWHPHCTCVAVPVYRRSGYATEAQEKAALEIYNRARRAAEDKSYKGILKEMRRSLYKPAEEQDETDLPSVA